MKLTVVDLFSGAGGMSTGFHRHGAFEIVGAVDLEKGKPGNGVSAGTSTMCNPTYRRNIGIEPWNQDIARLDPKALIRRLGLRRGGLDVLISCAPCTGFSQKNAANHVTDDPRNSLIGRTGDFVECSATSLPRDGKRQGTGYGSSAAPLRRPACPFGRARLRHARGRARTFLASVCPNVGPGPFSSRCATANRRLCRILQG